MIRSASTTTLYVVLVLVAVIILSCIRFYPLNQFVEIFDEIKGSIRLREDVVAFHSETIDHHHEQYIRSANESDRGQYFPIQVLEANTHVHCFVTAFMDLKRDKWSDSPRENNEYLIRFKRLVRLPEPMVIFIDGTLLSEISKIVSELRPHGIYTLIIPINNYFLIHNIYAWKLLEREKEIMNSKEYKSFLPGKLKNLPEHNVPEYTIINHAKIDFINYVISYVHSTSEDHIKSDGGNSDNNIDLNGTNINLNSDTNIGHGTNSAIDNTRYERYTWIDFGYIHGDFLSPKKSFRTHILSKTSVTYMTLKTLDPKDGIPMNALQNPTQKITGGFFSGTVPLLREYQIAYHKALNNYQKLNIADDDQALIPHIYYNYFSNLTFVKVASYKHGLLYVCDGITKRISKRNLR